MNNTTTNASLTAEQVALNEHIAAENAAFEAKCRAEGATFWCVNALTADDLAKYGVYNIDQFKQWSAEMEAQEAAKEQRKNWYNQ